MEEPRVSLFGETVPSRINPFEHDLVFVDAETSGLAPEYHEVIEIAVRRVTQPDRILVCEWSAKLKLDHPERFSAEAQAANGYTPEQWDDALPRAEAFGQFLHYLKESVPLSYKNDFDSSFLYHGLKRAGMLGESEGPPWYYFLDVLTDSFLRLYGRLDRLRSKNVAEYLGLEPEPEPHAALGGARLACTISGELDRRFRTSPLNV